MKKLQGIPAAAAAGNLPNNKNSSSCSSYLMSPPPLLHEEIGSATFAHDVAVLELERLFFREDKHHLQLCGPYTPSHSTGFSRRPVRVAYQGVRGSYCQEAALKAFSSISNIESFAACNTMEDAFQALEDKSAQRAIVPVENSIDGTIDRNLDLLLRHDEVAIVGELILPVNHCLLAVPGTSKSQLKRIVSHPQALSHCKSKLHQLGLETLDLEVDEVQNSADAARFVSENRIYDTAVIGSRMAAKEFNLQILEQNLQDDSNGNFNRFLQLGLREGCCSSLHVQEEDEEEQIMMMRRKRRNGSANKYFGGGRKKKKKMTTVAFSLEKGVSDLFRALGIFERENIMVTRVEQRPNRSNPVKMVVAEKKSGNHHPHHRYLFDYVFILDLELDVSLGNHDDDDDDEWLLQCSLNHCKLKTALSLLEEISGFIRVLGSYTCGGLIY
ncbi:Prephenate dehydratase [Macleaya cordata]|uniref:Prephenate dehydratase n=1 Tax=Macleaya cordata TaxID=56857 RepID=A0A200QSQ7_MACCD|nr:Prephenate dehydratase [Macleaya cordata]